MISHSPIHFLQSKRSWIGKIETTRDNIRKKTQQLHETSRCVWLFVCLTQLSELPKLVHQENHCPRPGICKAWILQK